MPETFQGVPVPELFQLRNSCLVDSESTVNGIDSDSDFCRAKLASDRQARARSSGQPGPKARKQAAEKGLEHEAKAV